MEDCSACIPRERVLAVCEWAKARMAEIGRKKDAATLQAAVKKKNRLRRWVRMKHLSEAEVHRRLLKSYTERGILNVFYPWRCGWWESEISELLTLARDADGGIRITGRDWQELLRWCKDIGWQDGEYLNPAE